MLNRLLVSFERGIYAFWIDYFECVRLGGGDRGRGYKKAVYMYGGQFLCIVFQMRMRNQNRNGDRDKERRAPVLKWNLHLIFSMWLFPFFEFTAECSEPVSYPDASYSVDTTLYNEGTYVVYTCDPGYRMIGDTDYIVHVCRRFDEGNMEWIGPTVACEGKDVPAENNQTITTNNNNCHADAVF